MYIVFVIKKIEKEKITSCSFNRSPIVVKLSPNNFKWAATSTGDVPDILTPLHRPGTSDPPTIGFISTNVVIPTFPWFRIDREGYAATTALLWLINFMVDVETFAGVPLSIRSLPLAAKRLARRLQLYFSLDGTLAHISPSFREMVAKSWSALRLSSRRISRAHNMYAVNRPLPLSVRTFLWTECWINQIETLPLLFVYTSLVTFFFDDFSVM